ncbi:MAG: Uma2 family endonuclease [Caldilineaceae bacterium]|nr:Uma2 family endonuclease [Caldilineaceae bacterium]HRJ42184.1 Uma2 family endonuclease [Caldilineaceae bacterium]
MAEAILEAMAANEVSGLLTLDEYPDISQIVTEDDTPVDNFPSEKQQRLLTEPLYSSWAGPGQGRTFVVAANVGLFASLTQAPLVPDVFLSLDTQIAEDWWSKGKRTYFFWEFGKPPEVVIELVSNQVGNETSKKMEGYARMGIAYYAIFDPMEQVQEGQLRVYALDPGLRTYAEIDPSLLPGVGLGLTIWRGPYEGREDVWIRWQDNRRILIPTGAERAEQERQRTDQERQRANQERQRANQEHQRANQERQRAERLAAQLRALGIEPDAGNGKIDL